MCVRLSVCVCVCVCHLIRVVCALMCFFMPVWCVQRTCVCAQRLPSCYVCFTVGQPFTGRPLWYVFRAISEQIYWLIIVKQVQCKWGNIWTVHQGHTLCLCRLKAGLMCVTNSSTQSELSESQTEETFSHTGFCQRNQTINEEHLSHFNIIVSRLKKRTN